jgi:hypothetical protein
MKALLLICLIATAIATQAVEIPEDKEIDTQSYQSFLQGGLKAGCGGTYVCCGGICCLNTASCSLNRCSQPTGGTCITTL